MIKKMYTSIIKLQLAQVIYAYVFLILQCFFTCLVYVKPGDQFRDHWPTNFGKSFKVSPKLCVI